MAIYGLIKEIAKVAIVGKAIVGKATMRRQSQKYLRDRDRRRKATGSRMSDKRNAKRFCARGAERRSPGAAGSTNGVSTWGAERRSPDDDDEEGTLSGATDARKRARAAQGTRLRQHEM